MLEKTTAGPWTVDRDAIIGPNGEIVAECAESAPNDAQLIAAAPDLYEALTEVLEYCQGAPATIMAQVDRALEKANGRTAALTSATATR